MIRMYLARREYINLILEQKLRGGSIKCTSDFEASSDEDEKPNFEMCEERDEVELDFKVTYKG